MDMSNKTNRELFKMLITLIVVGVIVGLAIKGLTTGFIAMGLYYTTAKPLAQLVVAILAMIGLNVWNEMSIAKLKKQRGY